MPNFLALLVSLAAFAAPIPLSIPRTNSEMFVAEGMYQGGNAPSANLESFRVADHPEAGFERWVIDFSDPTDKKVGRSAPPFQVKYLGSDRFTVTEGKQLLRRPPKFLLLLRSIAHNNLSMQKAKELARESQFVKDIKIYPPIEQGDMAIELILKDDVLFQAHQPLDREGRLVLDMKPKESVLND